MTDLDAAIMAVLADHNDPAERYRGKVRADPFVQGGHYWREAAPVDILRQHENAGPAHFAALRYTENEHGEPKDGHRELRGALRVWREDGRIWLGCDAEKWELV